MRSRVTGQTKAKSSQRGLKYVAETIGSQASRGEIDPEGIEVAETIGARAELHDVIEVAVIAAPLAYPSGDDDQPSPASLIKTFEATEIEAAKESGLISDVLDANMRSQ